ncbi:MAG: dethiobiotin synthase, partial [Verrucomicrobiota bacterium]
MTRGIFVTGTDTGVGKTILSAALLTEASRRGMNAAPMKPIQTGCEDGLAPDLEFCLEMAEMQPADKKAMAPWLFEPACSPHLAAEMA